MRGRKQPAVIPVVDLQSGRVAGLRIVERVVARLQVEGQGQGVGEQEVGAVGAAREGHPFGGGGGHAGGGAGGHAGGGAGVHATVACVAFGVEQRYSDSKWERAEWPGHCMVWEQRGQGSLGEQKQCWVRRSSGSGRCCDVPYYSAAGHHVCLCPITAVVAK